LGGYGRDPFPNLLLDLVAHLAEFNQAFFFGSGRCGRIVKGPVPTIHRSREKTGALFFSVGADDDQMRYCKSPEVFLCTFRILAAYIATDFPHDLFGLRVDLVLWLKTGAVNIKAIARIGSQETFGHLAPARVAGAKDKNRFPSFRHGSFLKC
jgi:hypothetical protein